MAKKSMIAREAKRKQCVRKYQQKRDNLKLQIKSTVYLEEKLTLYAKLQKLPRNSSAVRLHNRCAITGRPKGFYSAFGLSRQVLRMMSHNCLLPGVKKSSW